jgi:hypothetical protein
MEFFTIGVYNSTEKEFFEKLTESELRARYNNLVQDFNSKVSNAEAVDKLLSAIFGEDNVKRAYKEEKKQLANKLEDLIDANVSDPNLVADLRAARVEMAKINDYKRATNFGTNRIDPFYFAKKIEKNEPVSGIAADIGKIVAVYPDIAQPGKTGKPFWAPERLTRSTAAGTVGLAIGGLPGLIGGAVTGNIASGMAGRRMSTPAYQAKYAVPRDFRPPVNNLTPSTDLPNFTGSGVNNLRK